MELGPPVEADPVRLSEIASLNRLSHRVQVRCNEHRAEHNEASASGVGGRPDQPHCRFGWVHGDSGAPAYGLV